MEYSTTVTSKREVQLFYTGNSDGVSGASASKNSPLLSNKERNSIYKVFSNFAKDTPLTINGRYFPTSEHAYQASIYYAYAERTSDPYLQQVIYDFADQIAVASTANRAFTMAQLKVAKTTGYLSKASADPKYINTVEYEASKTAFDAGVRFPDMELSELYFIMKNVLLAKFSQNERALQILKSTKDKILVEHTIRDKIWGDGGKGYDTEHGNLLGKALMFVRDVL